MYITIRKVQLASGDVPSSVKRTSTVLMLVIPLNAYLGHVSFHVEVTVTVRMASRAGRGILKGMANIRIVVFDNYEINK